VISPAGIVRLRGEIVVGALRRSHARGTFAEQKKLNTLRIHGSSLDSICSLEFGLRWAELVNGNRFFDSRAFILLIRLAILAFVAIDDLMEWRPRFEEMRLLF